jgi:hypothetical protein
MRRVALPRRRLRLTGEAGFLDQLAGALPFSMTAVLIRRRSFVTGSLTDFPAAFRK